jgi:Cytochrome P460
MQARFGQHGIASVCIASGVVAALSSAVAINARAQNAAAAGPTYTADGRLEFPKTYREWIYLTSGLDMSYVPGATPRASVFDNVFVNSEAYGAFQKSGTWPDRTVLVLEVRSARQEGSINRSGHFQSGIVHTEVHVKDAARFGGNWAFFGFNDAAPAAMIPQTETCYSCHRDNGAVDTTFVQFYPTLLPIAREKKTLSPGYLAAETSGAPRN